MPTVGHGRSPHITKAKRARAFSLLREESRADERRVLTRAEVRQDVYGKQPGPGFKTRLQPNTIIVLFSSQTVKDFSADSRGFFLNGGLFSPFKPIDTFRFVMLY